MSDLAYFQRRLAAAQKATQLPASARYDLAASTLDDDAFDETVGEFGGPDPKGSGFGISDVMQEYLSRDPKTVPVESIQELQTNLVATGYLPKGFEATGVYDPVTSAAFRRQERDALDKVRSGSHFGSAPVKDFFRYLGYTVPTEVVKGAVGIANGIVKDAATFASNPVETLEEGGLLGGAAVGAMAGGSIGALFGGVGAVPGALIGGAVGGVGGFFADLFGDDDTPEEDDQDNWHKILDALTPVDEISAGQASNLFAALSTVMTASAVLKAGSLAVKGTQAAVASTQAAAAGTGRTTLQQAFTRGAKGTVEPGMVAKLGQSGIRHPAFGGAVTGGLVDALPEFLEADFGGAAKDFIRGAGVGAITGGTLGKAGLGLKTGKGTVGERAIKALDAAPIRRITETGAGKVAQVMYTGAATATIGGRLAGELPDTAQSKSIEEAQKMDFGMGGHVLDWTVGLAMYPERLLPWRARDMSRAMTTLASDNLLLPFAEAARKVRDESGQIVVTSLSKGMERARQTLGAVKGSSQIDEATLANRLTWSYVQRGLDAEVEDVMRTTPFETTLTGARAEQAKLERFGEIRSERIAKIREEMGETGTSETARRYFEAATSEPHKMQNHVENFEQGGSLLDEFAAHHEATEFLQQRSRMVAAGTAREGAVAEKPLTLTPAIRPDLPGGYQTRDDFLTLADEYEIAGNAYKEAAKQAKGASGDSPLLQGKVAAAERYDNVLANMRNRGMIDEGEYQTLRPLAGGDPIFKSDIAEELREVAATRPFEVKEETARLVEQTGNDRYIALSTGENILTYDHVPKLMEAAGIAELSRKPGFMHALSSLGTRIDRADAGKMRFNSIVDELDNVSVRNNLDMDGNTMANRIYDSLKTRYDVEAAARQGIRLETGKVKVRRTNERTGEVTKEWFKIDPRDLSTEDIHDALNLTGDYNLANEIKGALHTGAAFGANVQHPVRTARALGRALKVHGLPAFSDYMRTMNFVPKKMREMDKFASKGSYGYIGHNLRRAHMAIQFSISPTFDASRYVEAMTFGKMNDIPIKYALQPGKQIRKGNWKSPYSASPVTGGEAYNNMVRLGDEIFHGRPVMQNFDEIQLRAMHSGILGFKPRETEYAHAWVLAQRKMKNGKLTPEAMEDIRETVLQIHQYGGKQTAFGNSMHFTFFPFLFSFKQLRQFHDYTLSAPMRNVLVHEGMRRWDTLVDDETLGQKFSEAFKDHIPLAQELGRLNNLSYGVGPGRFFLEGIMDKDDEGKAVQALTEFFLPGGVHQPVASAFGEAADALKQFFVPQVWVDRDGAPMGTADKFGNIVKNLAPIYRDIDRWFFAETGGKAGPFKGVVGETVSTLSEGQNPMAQFTDLLDFKRVEGQALDEMAKASGYSGWESFSQSDAGAPIRAQVEEINAAVEASFPSGSRMANEFTNSGKAKDQALYTIATKPDKTKAEEYITAIGTIEMQAKMMASQVGISQEEMLRRVAPIIRSVASNLLNDRQGMNLYDEMFSRTYGPLRQLEVA